MLDLVFLLLLQQSGPLAPPSQAAPTEAIADAESQKQICSMEPITGTRARKQKVCRTPGYEKGGERSRDMLAGIQRASNGQPAEPARQGARPGGPGF